MFNSGLKEKIDELGISVARVELDLNSKLKNERKNVNDSILNLEKKNSDCCYDLVQANSEIKKELISENKSTNDTLSKLEDSMNDNLERMESELNNKLDQGKEHLNNLVTRFENKFEARLIQFHKEVTERYFEALEKIFRLNKEITLVNALSGQVKDKDYAILRAQFMKPFLEERWKEDKKVKGKEIESQGEWVISERARMYDEMLVMEKQEKPTEAIKERIAAFDSILERVEK